MDPTAYCRAKVAPPGSTGYYIARTMPESLQPLYLALQALCTEIEEGISECSEPSVAQNKLQWWHEELIACATPRHDTPLHRR